MSWLIALGWATQCRRFSSWKLVLSDSFGPWSQSQALGSCTSAYTNKREGSKGAERCQEGRKSMQDQSLRMDGGWTGFFERGHSGRVAVCIDQIFLQHSGGDGQEAERWAIPVLQRTEVLLLEHKDMCLGWWCQKDVETATASRLMSLISMGSAVPLNIQWENVSGITTPLGYSVRWTDSIQSWELLFCVCNDAMTHFLL